MTIPEPTVRLSRTWRFSYKRPKIGGWPLLRVIDSVLTGASYQLEPKRIVVNVLGGMIARSITDVIVYGSWVNGGHDTVQVLDIPGRRTGHTMAPDWVVEIAEDALARTRDVAKSSPRGDSVS
jgi:hypothetical protein